MHTHTAVCTRTLRAYLNCLGRMPIVHSPCIAAIHIICQAMVLMTPKTASGKVTGIRWWRLVRAALTVFQFTGGERQNKRRFNMWWELHPIHEFISHEFLNYSTGDNNYSSAMMLAFAQERLMSLVSLQQMVFSSCHMDQNCASFIQFFTRTFFRWKLWKLLPRLHRKRLFQVPQNSL